MKIIAVMVTAIILSCGAVVLLHGEDPVSDYYHGSDDGAMVGYPYSHTFTSTDLVSNSDVEYYDWGVSASGVSSDYLYGANIIDGGTFAGLGVTVSFDSTGIMSVTVAGTPTVAGVAIVNILASFGMEDLTSGDFDNNCGAYYHYSITISAAYTSSLSYNANGGYGGPGTQTYTGASSDSHAFTVASEHPLRSGYYFAGWATSSSATAVEYRAGDPVSVGASESLILYAVWKTFNVSPGYSIVTGDSISLKNVVADGCTVTVSGADWLTASGNSISGSTSVIGTYSVIIGCNGASTTIAIIVSSVLANTNSPTNGVIVYAG